MPRPSARAIVVAGISVLAAGCGGTHQGRLAAAGTGHALPRASASQAAAALKASRCMRAHGVPNWPDPILGGHFGFMAGSGVNPYTPQYKAAYAYCTTRYRIFKHLATPEQLAQSNAAAVKFSHCMRAHGVGDFPDPDGKGAIELPTGEYINTPKVQRGRQACRSLFTGKGILFVVPIPVN